MTAPAGWYADEFGITRYWDGSAWTAHVAPTHDAGAIPPVAMAPIVPAQVAAVHAPAPYPGPYPVQPYGAVVPVALAGNGPGVAGFVIGLVSLFLPLFLGLAGGVAGLIFSIVGLSRVGARKGLAIAGLILSILALILIF